jgi:predicted nuclease with TOPRIM domain
MRFLHNQNKNHKFSF